MVREIHAERRETAPSTATKEVGGRTTNRPLESPGLYADGNTPRLFSPHLKHKGYESNY